MRSMVHAAVEHPTACLFHRAAAAAACGGFAAERRAGGRYRSTEAAPGAEAHDDQLQMRAVSRLQLT